MSEIASALPDAVFDGLARIEEAGPSGMVTVKGDLGDATLRKAVAEVAGVDLPKALGAATAGDHGVLWMAPDELLVLTPYAEAADSAARLAQALAGTHSLVANVSDARAVFTLSGEQVRDVLAKLTPADLHPSALAPGTVRRTRFAQVPAAFWLSDSESATVICFRSVAQYVFDSLCHAARPGTSPGHF
ncbi:MAG: sarcosine oxidase subunit gamma family protein [Pseudomonadota bacterium]